MGLQTYTNAWKNCATCNFWEGPRKIAESHESVNLDNAAVGQCTGFWKGSQKFSSNKCSEWVKWTELGNWSGKVREVYP